MSKKIIKLVPPVAIICFIILIILYFNSYSIVLWTNGFSNKDVYENISIKDTGPTATQAVLVANDKHFGIFNMSKNSIGLWKSENMPLSIIEKSSHWNNCVAQAIYYHMNLLPSSSSIRTSDFYTYCDYFLAGLINLSDSKKVYSLPKQPGCLVSADLHMISDNQFLVFFHITSLDIEDSNNNNTEDPINKATDYIEKSFTFKKSVVSD